MKIKELNDILAAKDNIPNPYPGSKGYELICNRLLNHQNIPDNSVEWAIISDSFKNITPDFFNDLENLTKIKLKEQERRFLILCRYGFTTTEISIVLAKAKSTVSYRKEVLNQKLFHGKFDIKHFCLVIRLL